MHEYKRFIQAELDARGWRQADLVRKSGLSRQLISNILRDDRDHLGQMPDAETLEGIARGFGIPVERVRTAAARSIADYEDNGNALTITLSDVSTDALLTEIRRRIDERPATQSADPPLPSTAQPRASSTEIEKTGDNVVGLPHRNQPEQVDEDPVDAWAARPRDPKFGPADPHADGSDIGEENQDPEDSR